MDRLREFLPAQKNDLTKITDIFNESRYSLHLLGEDARKDFKVSIDRVLAGIGERRR